MCECDVSDIVFTSGSIVVSFVLQIATDTSTSIVLFNIQQAAIAGTLIDGYDVDADHITFGGASGEYRGVKRFRFD